MFSHLANNLNRSYRASDFASSGSLAVTRVPKEPLFSRMREVDLLTNIECLENGRDVSLTPKNETSRRESLVSEISRFFPSRSETSLSYPERLSLL